MRRISRGDLSFLALAVALGIACFFFRGPEATRAALGGSLVLLLEIAPVLVGALLIGGYFHQLMPREKVAVWLGAGSGFRGLVLATVAGVVTPGGPFLSFPLVVVLSRAGADMGTLVAYLTAWSVLGSHRTIVYEVPLLGSEFVLLRVLASLPLPIIAGLAARWLARLWKPRDRGAAEC